MESKEKQGSVPMLCCVVGGLPVGWAVSKLDRCSLSRSKEAHFLSPGLENIQPLEIGNGMKADNHRKIQATFRTHWILPSSSFLFSGKKNDTFPSSILQVSVGKCVLKTSYMSPILAPGHTGCHFCSIERRAEFKEDNLGIDFSTVRACNPIHVFR